MLRWYRGQMRQQWPLRSRTWRTFLRPASSHAVACESLLHSSLLKPRCPLLCCPRRQSLFSCRIMLTSFSGTCSSEAVAQSLPLPVLARLQREAGTPFNVLQGPLVRALLVNLGSSDHLMLLTMHHAICDGWSFKVSSCRPCHWNIGVHMPTQCCLLQSPISSSRFILEAFSDSEVRFTSEIA